MSQSNENAPIALDSLPIPQLTQVKKQLDEEVQHLSFSFQSLRGAQSKFRECLRCIRLGLGGSGDVNVQTVAPSSSSPKSSATTTTTPSAAALTSSSSTTSQPTKVSRSAVDKTILVPLTPSLYVPGVLAPPPRSRSSSLSDDDDDDDKDHSSGSSTPCEQTVMVDIGTGYFVDKTLSEADDFYSRKVAELDTSLANLEKILKVKSDNLRVVEEVLRQKLFAESTQPSAPAAAKA